MVFFVHSFRFIKPNGFIFSVNGNRADIGRFAIAAMLMSPPALRHEVEDITVYYIIVRII